MKRSIVVALTLVMVLVMGISFAGADEESIPLEDLKGLTNNVRNALINKKLKDLESSEEAVKESTKKVLANLDPDKAEKWAKVISSTIKTISTDLSVGVNEFVKTDVGKITMFLIVYKVIGGDIKGIVIGIPLWLLIVSVLLVSFRHFHGSQKLKIKDKEGNITDIKYIPRFTWALDRNGGSEAKVGSAIAHMLIFVGISVVLALVIMA